MSGDWEDEARKEQQLYFSLLGDRLWDTIDAGESTVLMRKVGYGLFGPPCELPTDVNEHTGYSAKKLKHVKEVTSQLRDHFDFDKEALQFTCLHVIARIGNETHTLPIFKAKSEKSLSDSCIFVDWSSRVYASWLDWLEHEKLPACTYCVPVDGVYKANSENRVELLFRDSNACSLSSRTVRVLDGTSTLLSIGATAIGVASLFVPIAGPILYASALTAGAAGTYGAGRSINELVDRGRHSQSISLKDREARGYWLSVASSSFSVGAQLIPCKLLTRMAATATASHMTDRAKLLLSTATQIGCRSTDCLKIIHACEGLVHNAEKGEVEPLLIFQLTASILFFTNNLIKFHTACRIIKELQEDSSTINDLTRINHGKSPPDMSLDDSFELVLPDF